MGLFACVLLASAVAFSADGDPAAAATAKLAELAKYPAHRALAAEPYARAEHALRRARDARAAGDVVHAPLLEETADEWASTAADLVRASNVEGDAARLQQQVAEAETRLVRAQALLEETSARRSLALQKLRELQPESDEKPPLAAPETKPSAAPPPAVAPGAKP